MTATKSERWQEVYERARRRFDAVQSALRDERKQCLEDRRFYSIAGAQWEGPLGEQFENAPRFEVNKVHLAVIRIINEYRNNRISVTFTPKDGSDGDELADTCDGLYRADEQDSGAGEAYDNAFEEAVGGGFGAYRLRACYEDESDEDNDEQRIRFEPIFDADTTVFFDLDARRQDKADAKRCWVLNPYSPDAYEEEFDDSPASWPRQTDTGWFDWNTPDIVWVAEYYEVEEKSEIVHVFRGLDNQDMMVPDKELQDDPEKLGTLEATGFREVRQKKVKRKKVHKYLMSGAGILEDCGYIAGTEIPIVPVYGKRWYIDGIERCMGHVRLAKDSQRLKNMQLSRLGEISALSPIEKPIFTPEQMAGHTQQWADDNVKKYPYLLVNAMEDAEGNKMPSGPIGYTKAPTIPQAMAALLTITEQDMQDVLGNQQAGEEMQTNMSGKAVELIQNRLDMQSFIYMDNNAKARKRGGEIWLSMAKEVYADEGRVMKTIGANDEVSSVELMRPMFNAETGKEYHENDLTGAKFDLTADVGPTSSSRRAGTVRALTGMLAISQDPETQLVLQSMAMMNMEGEGLSDVRDFFRKKLLRMGALKPTDEETQEMQQEQANQPPDPNAEYLKAAAEQASADAALNRAKTVQSIADANLKQAQTQKTVAETVGEHNSQQIASADALKRFIAPNSRQ